MRGRRFMAALPFSATRSRLLRSAEYGGSTCQVDEELGKPNSRVRLALYRAGAVPASIGRFAAKKLLVATTSE